MENLIWDRILNLTSSTVKNLTKYQKISYIIERQHGIDFLYIHKLLE